MKIHNSPGSRAACTIRRREALACLVGPPQLGPPGHGSEPRPQQYDNLACLQQHARELDLASSTLLRSGIVTLACSTSLCCAIAKPSPSVENRTCSHATTIGCGPAKHCCRTPKDATGSSDSHGACVKSKKPTHHDQIIMRLQQINSHRSYNQLKKRLFHGGVYSCWRGSQLSVRSVTYFFAMDFIN